MVNREEFIGLKTKYLYDQMFHLYKFQCKDCLLDCPACLYECFILAGDISDEIDIRRREGYDV